MSTLNNSSHSAHLHPENSSQGARTTTATTTTTTTMNNLPTENTPEDPTSINPTASTADNGPVQAYAKLESDTFCYYIRTLQVMLGRKAGSADEVDIHLGSTKGISRQHARLFYNFLNQRFELIVYGKNGAFVNEQFIEKGSTVPLEHRTKVQIGEATFHFLLPKMELEEATHENYPYLTGSEEYHQQAQSLQGQPQQAIPFQSAALQSHAQMSSSSQPHRQAEIRHNATAAAGNPNIVGTSLPESEQGAPREGEVFDTSEYNNKDVKPPFSYASLIAQAINTSRNKKLTLNGIYNYITSHYPYYQMAQNGWQNSIRHNLSLNKAFIKVPRGDNEPGKGAFWTIDASCEGQFRNGVYRKSRRQPTGKAEGSTGPVRTTKASPAVSSPYSAPTDPNSKRSTSSKSSAPPAGTPHSAKPVIKNDRPAVLGNVPGPMQTSSKTTTSLLGNGNSGVTSAYNTSTIPNASTTGATVPKVSTTYTTSPYLSSLPANATTSSTTFSPALQLLTAAAALSSPELSAMMTHNTTTPQGSASTVTNSLPSSDGSTAQRNIGTSDSILSGSGSNVEGRE